MGARIGGGSTPGWQVDGHTLARKQDRCDWVTFLKLLWARTRLADGTLCLATCLFVTDLFHRIVGSSPDRLSLCIPSFLKATSINIIRPLKAIPNSPLFQCKKCLLSGHFVRGDFCVPLGMVCMQA